MGKKLDLLLIRHAESQYNRLVIDENDRQGLTQRDQYLIMYTKFRLDQKLLDSDLSEIGVKQCLEGRQNLAESLKKVKLVITTPSTRTLHTSRLLFNTEAGLPEGLRVVVIPGFERVESICDVFCKTEDNFERFKEFDHSIMRKEVEEFGWAWFVNKFSNPGKRRRILEYVEKNANKFDSYPSNIANGLATTEFMKTLAPELLESHVDFYPRYEAILGAIRRVLSREENKDLESGEVAFVAHSTLLKYMTAKEIGDDSKPIGNWDFQNCEAKLFPFNVFASI